MDLDIQDYSLVVVEDNQEDNPVVVVDSQVVVVEDNQGCNQECILVEVVATGLVDLDRTSVAAAAIVPVDLDYRDYLDRIVLAAEQLQFDEVVGLVGCWFGHHSNIFCTNNSSQSTKPSGTSNLHNLQIIKFT